MGGHIYTQWKSPATCEIALKGRAFKIYNSSILPGMTFSMLHALTLPYMYILTNWRVPQSLVLP